MSNNGFRLVALSGVLVILAGMVIAGFPLAWVVAQEAYGQAAPIPLSGDYRGWMMAHLEGLLNGLLMIAIAGVTRVGTPMKSGVEGRLLVALLVTGWGNVIAAILAPALGVRGIAINDSLANNVVVSLFTVALIASFYAFAVVIRHLAQPVSPV